VSVYLATSTEHCRTGKNGWGQKTGVSCWDRYRCRVGQGRQVYMRYRCTPAEEPFCLYDRSQLPCNALWERYLRAGCASEGEPPCL
jgi:hypothetical protein